METLSTGDRVTTNTFADYIAATAGHDLPASGTTGIVVEVEDRGGWKAYHVLTDADQSTFIASVEEVDPIAEIPESDEVKIETDLRDSDGGSEVPA